MLILDILINNHSICEYETFTSCFPIFTCRIYFPCLIPLVRTPGRCWIDKLVFSSLSSCGYNCASWDRSFQGKQTIFVKRRRELEAWAMFKRTVTGVGLIWLHGTSVLIGTRMGKKRPRRILKACICFERRLMFLGLTWGQLWSMTVSVLQNVKRLCSERNLPKSAWDFYRVEQET